MDRRPAIATLTTDSSAHRLTLVAAILVTLLTVFSVVPAYAASATPAAYAASATPAAYSPHSATRSSAESFGASGNRAVAASDETTIHRTVTLFLTPDAPGRIGVVVTFEIPASVRSLETTVPSNAAVTRTVGFTRNGTRDYAWDGETASPSISFTLDVNETTATSRTLHSSPGPGYSFVDTGSWALVRVPQFSTSWTYVGPRVGFERTVLVEGEGATGGEIAYLGPHETYTRTAHGQRFQFVVPKAASLVESPSTILDSIAAASDALRVGARDELVFFVAAPSDVQWDAAGIEYGGSDFWVVANSRLDDPRNVWLHEYVHTRQDYRPATGARWTLEAGAEYYAALLTLRQGYIGFPAFRAHVERGTREPPASAILEQPSTWSSGAHYLKGALVYGAVDRQIRLDTNSTRSMQAVLSRMNDDTDPVTASEFYSFVGEAGTAATRAYAEHYASTSDAPTMWSTSEHERAFSDLPARVSYRAIGLRITGPYRSTPLEPGMTLVTGENVTATVQVSNTGGAAGVYEVTLRLDGTTVAANEGTIDAGAVTAVTVTHTLAQPGRYTLRVADLTRDIVVELPARPRVRELTVETAQTASGVDATITVGLLNPEMRPAAGTIPVTVDGATVATIQVGLAPNASTTRTVTTQLDPGTHTITAGNTATTINVPSTTTSSADGPGTDITVAPTPGLGTALTSIALLLTLLAATRTT